MGIVTVLMLATLLGSLFAFIGFLLWKALDYGKSWVVLLDDDSGKAVMIRQKIISGEFTRKDPSGKKRRYKVESRARYGTNRGSLHLLERRSGWNLTAPSHAEMENTEDRAELLVNNPLLYYNAIRSNEIEDALNANSGEEPWYAKVAGLALVAVFATLAAVIWVAYQISDRGGA